MSRWRKKPIVIEAFRFLIDPQPDWFCDRVSSNQIITYPSYCIIQTANLESWATAQAGDWIVKDESGEVCPCKPDIFEATYEPAD
jgi:hypothetical protein